jgi:hypothetical protein
VVSMNNRKFVAIILAIGSILLIGCAASQQPASMAIQPDSMSFLATVGGPNPPSQTIDIKNVGNGQIAWKIAANAQWMQVGPESGSTQGSEVHEVTVSVTTKDVPIGNYRATIAIVAEGTGQFHDTVLIPVTYIVNPSGPQGHLATQPDSMNFQATVGGPNPPSQTINIRNIGPQGSQVQWKVGTKAQWMQLGPDSGSLKEHNEIDEVAVSVTTRDVPAGTYKATIAIVAEGADNSPILIPVTYTIRPS